MSVLAEIDSLIRETEQRHARELCRLLDVRRSLARSQPMRDADPEWLSLAEIAALPPRRTTDAVRKAIGRASSAPHEVRRRGRAAIYPRVWLVQIGVLTTE